MERTRSAWFALLLASAALLGRAHAQTPAPVAAPTQAAADQQPTAPLLPLSEAVEIALAHNSAIRTGELETTRAADTLAASKTQRYPQTQVVGLGAQLVTKPSVTFPAGSLGTYTSTGPIPGTNKTIEIARKPAGTVSVLVAEPLSTQYQLHLQVKALAAGLDVSRDEQDAKRKEVIDELRRAYYSVVAAQSARDSLQALLPYYLESQRLARENRSRETILESDLLNADAQLLKLKNAIADANDRVASASEHLNDLMGRDVSTRFRVADPGDADRDDSPENVAEAQAVQSRPDLAKAQAQVRAADYDARAKKAEYIPEINLAFSYYTTANFENVLPSNVGTLGLSLKWEPWDWNRKRDEYKAKRAQAEQAEVAVSATERGIRLEVRNALRQLESTRRELALSDAEERTSRQKLKEVQEQVTRNAALSRDLFGAQSALASADSQHEQALASFWKARADLKKAMGDE